jgi:pimeloyl-ACP methyl ester carboxylesterase
MRSTGAGVSGQSGAADVPSVVVPAPSPRSPVRPVLPQRLPGLGAAKNLASLGLLGMGPMSNAAGTRSRPGVRRLGGALIVLAVLAGAACSDDDSGGGEQAARRSSTTATTAAATTTTTTEVACGAKGATDITFGAGRVDADAQAQLHAIFAGPATEGGPAVGGDVSTTVVLAHEAQEDACDWAPYVRVFTEGYGWSALAFDFSGNGSSDTIGDGRLDLDLRAAVAEARRRGAKRVIVIGASKGATAALAAAATPNSGIDAAVSFSAVSSYLDTDAEAGAAGIKIPVLLVASEDDGSTADTARTVADRCGCAYPKVVVVSGSRHGRQLFTLIADADEGNPDGIAISDAMDAFVSHVVQ